MQLVKIKKEKEKGNKKQSLNYFCCIKKRDIHWGSMLEIIVRIDFTLIFTMNLLLIIF